MYKKKRIVKTALAFLFVFSLMAFPAKGTELSAAEAAFLEQVPLEVRQKIERQSDALAAHEVLYGNLTADGTYPEDYGGTYINDEGKLVVQLVRPTISPISGAVDRAMVSAVSPATESRYSSMSNNSDAVVYEYVDYSYNELDELMEVGEKLSTQYAIASYAVDQMQNCLLVSVLEKDFDLVMKDPAIDVLGDRVRVETSDAPIATTLVGGAGITVDGSAYSIGVCGRYGSVNGPYAILTAGHGMEDSPLGGPQSVYYNGTNIGSVEYQRCNIYVGENTVDAYGDFSIVAINNAESISNLVKYQTGTVPITGVYTSVPVGTTLLKYGNATGYSYGPVQFTNVTVKYYTADSIESINPENHLPIYEVRGMLQSFMESSSAGHGVNAGDSGGAVYTQAGSGYHFCGTVSGGKTQKNYDEIRIMYTSPVYYAMDAGFYPCTVSG